MLTKEQIEQLFRFCEKHLVYYYEVQVELVDHLANAVEEEMAKDKTVSFEDALGRVHSRFGVMGFAPLVSEKEMQIRKKAKGIYLKLFKQQFGWPQILTFLIFTGLSYTVSRWNVYVGFVFLIGIVLLGITGDIYQHIKFSRRIKKSGKKLMTKSYSYQFNLGSLLLLTYVNVLFLNFLSEWLVALVTGIYFVAFVTYRKLNQNMVRYLKETYPEVFQLAT